jgi:hypothetical protein
MTVALANSVPSFHPDRTSLVLFVLGMVTVSRYLFYPADRDTGRWKLDLNETQRRREVFWELYVYDSWQASMQLGASISINVHFIQCLTFGRPPAFTTAHVDCKMPFQGEPSGEDACQYYTCSGDGKGKLTFD